VEKVPQRARNKYHIINLNTGGDITAVIDQALELAEIALQESEAMQSKVAQLEGEKIILEKVASKSPFNPQVVEASMKRLEDMGLFDPAACEKIAAELNQNPNSVFRLLDRVSETLLTIPGDGHGIKKEAGTESNDEDPDGWHAFAQGRPVAVRK